jgi:hypothetical protein
MSLFSIGVSRQISVCIRRRSEMERDLVGYGKNVPQIQWPGGARIAVSLVVNYEEGSEYSTLDGD